MSGTLTPLPNTPSWCGAQKKHRYNFNLCLRGIAEGKLCLYLASFYYPDNTERGGQIMKFFVM